MILGSGIRDRLGSGFHAPCTSEHLVQSWMTIFFAVCRCYNCLFLLAVEPSDPTCLMINRVLDHTIFTYVFLCCIPHVYKPFPCHIIYTYIYIHNIYIYIVLFFVRPWLDTLIIKYHLIIITSDLSRFEQHSKWFKRSISIYTKVSSDIECYHQIFFGDFTRHS